ncbi:hypothetical protein A2U01_0070054, partial [Trifolium medium]|nr:hypothetical protein [Trifolium medium]
MGGSAGASSASMGLTLEAGAAYRKAWLTGHI